MAYDLQSIDRPQLDSLLSSDNVSTHTQIINYLSNAGLFGTPPGNDTTTIVVDTETSAPGAPVAYSPTAQFLIVNSSQAVVTTDNALGGIVDTAANSTIDLAGSANVVVSAADGNDQIFLFDSGNDAVYLGAGDGQINAVNSTGNDSLFAGSGNDALYGGRGHDTLIGGVGDDNLVAGSGSGVLQSGSQSSIAGSLNVLGDSTSTAHTLQGSSGADSLYAGGSGNDQLISGSVAGGPGNFLQVTSSDSGNNSLQGGAGNDFLSTSGTGIDTLHGGTGDNTLEASPDSGGGELISGSQSSIAGSYNILADTSATAHTMQGSSGQDSLYAGGSGNDKLISGSTATGPGNYLDVVTGDTGNNSLQAGLGIDQLWTFGSGIDTLQGGTGDDSLTAGSTSGGGELLSGSQSSIAGSYNVLGDTSATAHTLGGSSGADSLYAGGSGNDLLQSGSVAGGPGSYLDVVTSDTGNNSLQAGLGNDQLLTFGAGSDTLHGGTGFDTLYAGQSSGGGELISGSSLGTANILSDLSSTAHTLQGALGSDSLYAGGSGNDLLISGGGAQRLDATLSTGDDTLKAIGTVGDTLLAGSGNDVLDGSGSSGNSDFYSAAGFNSTMIGGSGIDSFQVSNNPIGAANNTTVDITVGSASAQDYVGFQDRDQSDLSGPIQQTTSAGTTTYTLSFTDGQTVNVSGTTGSGTDIQLIFGDGTINKTT